MISTCMHARDVGRRQVIITVIKWEYCIAPLLLLARRHDASLSIASYMPVPSVAICHWGENQKTAGVISLLNLMV
jgi:hypothetical protein